MNTVTIWRTCPSCDTDFEQPDDPGRKRVYCSRACQQAAYRARQRAQPPAGERARRQQRQEDQRRQEREREQWREQQEEAQRQRDREEEAAWWRRQREEARRRERAEREYARRQEDRQRAQPPPSGNGYRTYEADTPERQRARRVVDALLRKAERTNFPHEAAACREKAEELRRKHNL